MEQKTNVMRMLDQSGVPYLAHSYAGTGAISGVEVADVLGQPRNRVYKTLVSKGKSGQQYVFVIPSDQELDLKKAAAAAEEKSIEMIKTKDLLTTTGYVHGGCSPIGMKRPFPTFIDAGAASFETIYFSGGKIGYQVELGLSALMQLISCKTADLCTRGR